MTECIEITPQQAWEMLQHDDAAVLADVRDAQTFSYAHPKGAFNLTEATWPHFEALYDYDQPIILSCYHGISSRNVAAFLLSDLAAGVTAEITYVDAGFSQTAGLSADMV